MLKTDEIRQKFIDFFRKKDHLFLLGSSLVPENDPSVLFTSAGMQQFKQFYLKPSKAPAKKVVTCQPCLRTSDIDEVGDTSHLTFFEMLGNFSFDDYFKKETVEMAIEFLTKELGLKIENLDFYFFEGDQETPADQESVTILKKIGIQKIRKASREDNFWGPTGEEGPCGPTIDIYSKGIEIWSLVFNQYYKNKSSHYTKNRFKGVDTGMGLERTSMILQGKDNLFEIDLFEPIINQIIDLTQSQLVKVNEKIHSLRIIADHLRGIVFLLAGGIFPSNKEQGYVLRRLIRRIIIHARLLSLRSDYFSQLVPIVINLYQNQYPRLNQNRSSVLNTLLLEEKNFSQTLEKGLKEFNKYIQQKKIDGQAAFRLYDTYGFPLEITQELAQEKQIKVDVRGFNQAMANQKSQSRHAAEKFKELAPNPKLHTAAHLLHQALHDVLGSGANQAGQDISGEELRFDFFHPQKLTEKQIKKIEKIVNEKIKANLKVKDKSTTVEQAKKEGAFALFGQKYGHQVTLYQIGDFSKELCAGPHIKETGQLRRFVITSEKSAASGIRRIKARVG